VNPVAGTDRRIEGMFLSKTGPTGQVRLPAGDTGDPWAAFEAEALPHVDRLFRMAMWFERNRSEAEDLVQETMLQALQSFERFERGTNCGAWLARILHHVRSNRERSRRRSPSMADPEHCIERTLVFSPPVPERLSDADLLAALARIPEHYQEVILLCDVDELTYREIADALAIPIGTVMSRLHRGRSLLRSELGVSVRESGDRRAIR
jgi:RNA polymerase sigma-70 factor, ECF subfamily